MKFIPHSYQVQAAQHLASHPCCSLLADPGTGKTAIILALLKGLKKLNPKHRALVLAPRRVVYDVWPAERDKWNQFQGLTCRVLHGDRKNIVARVPADFYLLNFEGLQWAAEVRILHKFDTLIVDESSKMKDWTSKRMLTLKRYLGQFSRRHILTGSPMPKTLIDYFAQQFIVDMGATLGHSVTAFQKSFFYDASYDPNYHVWMPRHGAFETVTQMVAPHAFRLDGEQLLDLPAIQVNDISISLDNYDRYKQLTAEHLGSEGEVFQLSRQLASGFLSDGAVFHTQKLEALTDLVDSLQGKPLLVFSCFRKEGEAISRHFKCPLVYGGTPDRRVAEITRAWNKGSLPVVVMNPATTGHGLNLQEGGHHLAWFSLPTSQDDYYQAIRRLRRQGQKAHTVFVHRLLAARTVDTRLVQLLDQKTAAQQQFMDSIQNA